MKISIVIPIFNVREYVHKCISSCLFQTYKDIEIICVNDGSSDGVEIILEQFKALDNRIIVINKLNEGVTFAKDLGVRKASGEYVFFLDGDDYIPENAIELLVEHISSDIDVVVGNIVCVADYVYTQLKKLKLSRFAEMSGNEFLSMLVSLNRWSQCAMLIKKSSYEEIDFIPFHIVVREDALIMMQLCSIVGKVVCVDIDAYYYIQRLSSVLHTKTSIDTRSLRDLDFCIEASRMLDIVKGISKENQILLRIQLIKELSITLKSKVIVEKYKDEVQSLIKRHWRYSGLRSHLLKEGLKSYLMNFASSKIPQFWVYASGYSQFVREKTVKYVGK